MKTTRQQQMHVQAKTLLLSGIRKITVISMTMMDYNTNIGLVEHVTKKHFVLESHVRIVVTIMQFT